jgi:hypothetical protein
MLKTDFLEMDSFLPVNIVILQKPFVINPISISTMAKLHDIW